MFMQRTIAEFHQPSPIPSSLAVLLACHHQDGLGEVCDLTDSFSPKMKQDRSHYFVAVGLHADTVPECCSVWN